jgi:hypothetical protein
MEHNSLVKG